MRKQRRQKLSHSSYETIFARLKKLQTDDEPAFYLLVMLCRNPLFELAPCTSATWVCLKYHVHCKKTEDFQDLVESIDYRGRATIQPAIREIVLACTPSAQMPRLVPLPLEA